MVHRCYVGDSPQPTWEECEGKTSPHLFTRSQARLTKTVKVSYRVAEAHAGSDRRFLPSHTGVSLFCGRMQKGWVLIRQHSGSLSTGSSAGRLFRRRLNVQSGHREVRRARREMHQAMPREKGNTEKVGMVTCCQESRGRRPSTQCNLLGAKSMGPGTTECTSADKLGGAHSVHGAQAYTLRGRFSGNGCRPRVHLRQAKVGRVLWKLTKEPEDTKWLTRSEGAADAK